MPLLNRHRLKAKLAGHEITSLALGHRFAKLKADRGLAAAADRPKLGELIARRTAGRPWSKSKAPSE